MDERILFKTGGQAGFHILIENNLDVFRFTVRNASIFHGQAVFLLVE